MQEQQKTGLYQPETVTDALAVLSNPGLAAKVMAGGTWIMRAPLRHEPMAQTYVTLARIAGLHRIDVTESHVTIGSGVTHARLAGGLEGIAGFQALVSAAGRSANPAVRRTATVGGNLCTPDFHAADLIPALICLDALVEFETLEGRRSMSLEAFLTIRETLPPACLLLSVQVPRRPVVSAHARLPLRKAGDYPVAIVSVSLERRPDGSVGNVRIATGAVEVTARRWGSLEEAITGGPPDPISAYEHAARLCREFVGREGPETPGWYRLEVLPTLVRRAFEDLQKL